MKLCSPGHGFAAGIALVSCSALLGAMAYAEAPPGQYQVSSDVVVDVKTRLAWQRAALSPSTLAAGSISAASYCEGLHLGAFSEGWRVPTRKELETLVDAASRVRGGPTIDEAAFPDTAATFFCTSTPALKAADIWVVDFAVGGSYLVYPPNDVC